MITSKKRLRLVKVLMNAPSSLLPLPDRFLFDETILPLQLFEQKIIEVVKRFPAYLHVKH